MAVKIRLRQQGRANHRTFRLVACDSHVKRDGKYLDNLGWYDPFLEKGNAKINEERLEHWIQVGAEVTSDAERLIARFAPSVMKKWNEQREAKKVKVAAQKRASRKKRAVSAAK